MKWDPSPTLALPCPCQGLVFIADAKASEDTAGLGNGCEPGWWGQAGWGSPGTFSSTRNRTGGASGDTSSTPGCISKTKTPTSPPQPLPAQSSPRVFRLKA